VFGTWWLTKYAMPQLPRGSLRPRGPTTGMTNTQ
jgi:hypothetical protein